jgi:hypothetical protein
MIVYKQWFKNMKRFGGDDKQWSCEGWFLFGFIPLYIRRVGMK